MYILRIDHVRYTYDPTDRTKTPFTLVTAMRAAYGCGNAHIERADGTTVVAHAGRAYTDHTYGPTGRRLRRGARRSPAPAPKPAHRPCCWQCRFTTGHAPTCTAG